MGKRPQDDRMGFGAVVPFISISVLAAAGLPQQISPFPKPTAEKTSVPAHGDTRAGRAQPPNKGEASDLQRVPPIAPVRVPRDFEDADLAALKKAATRGDRRAQSQLGDHYDNGRGVPTDHAEAVRWWRAAAEQGDAHAQVSLAGAYVKGEGVRANFGEAVRWWRKAAAQGHAGAESNVGTAYSIGQGGCPKTRQRLFAGGRKQRLRGCPRLRTPWPMPTTRALEYE
jgi:hypothetical protein